MHLKLNLSNMEINFLKNATGQPRISPRVFDFLSSFGIMLVGVALMFVGSVTVTAQSVRTLVAELPRSERKTEALGGDTMVYKPLPVSRPAVPLQKDTDTFSVPITAEAALVVDDETNTVLYKKNSSDVRSLASISKLMSALVLNQLPIKWANTTIVTDEDYDNNSHHINVGEKYTLEDLWHIALIGSSNSAILTLVHNSGLTQEEFVARMNSYAAELGLTSLRFVEPTGLDSRNMGNAQDIAKLLKEALKVRRIADTLSIGEYFSHPAAPSKSRRVWSTDWLLTKWVPSNFDADQIVGKTGYISESGYNFTVRITGKNKHAIRVVVLGSAANETRFSEARDLAEWTYTHFVWPAEDGYAALSN